MSSRGRLRGAARASSVGEGGSRAGGIDKEAREREVGNASDGVEEEPVLAPKAGEGDERAYIDTRCGITGDDFERTAASGRSSSSSSWSASFMRSCSFGEVARTPLDAEVGKASECIEMARDCRRGCGDATWIWRSERYESRFEVGAEREEVCSEDWITARAGRRLPPSELLPSRDKLDAPSAVAGGAIVATLGELNEAGSPYVSSMRGRNSIEARCGVESSLYDLNVDIDPRERSFSIGAASKTTTVRSSLEDEPPRAPAASATVSCPYFCSQCRSSSRLCRRLRAPCLASRFARSSCAALVAASGLRNREKNPMLV